MVSWFILKANYNDSDGGILFGRWTETYPKNCTPPTAWTGSTAILEKFMKKKFYVKYGQCWVFSGLVTTCRLSRILDVFFFYEKKLVWR